MYYVGIWYVWNNGVHANTDQIHAFFQYVTILTPIHSPILAQYNQIQTYTSSNTDQYKHHRPMHTSLFSILAFLYANTGIGTVKSGAPPRTATPVCQRYLSLPSRHCSMPIGHQHTVPLCCETAELSTLPQISLAPILLKWHSLHCRLLGRQNHCQCP